jgi:Arc/MetJ family transcription regulator
MHLVYTGLHQYAPIWVGFRRVGRWLTPGLHLYECEDEIEFDWLNNTQKCEMFTHREAQVVRTNIEIDDDLMRQAMRRSGAATKKAAVEEALQLLVKTHEQTSIRRWRGKVQWEGNLKQLRRSRVPQ